MWPALLLCSSAIGLALGLARLKVFALIPATLILSLAVPIVGVETGLHWGMIVLSVIAAATIVQSSYLIGAILSEAPSPRAAPHTSLRLDLIRAAQFAIGAELRTQLQTPHDLPRQLRTRMRQLAVRYG
jgi:membrane protein DedA with SNARE-associated domain